MSQSNYTCLSVFLTMAFCLGPLKSASAKAGQDAPVFSVTEVARGGKEMPGEGISIGDPHIVDRQSTLRVRFYAASVQSAVASKFNDPETKRIADELQALKDATQKGVESLLGLQETLEKIYIDPTAKINPATFLSAKDIVDLAKKGSSLRNRLNAALETFIQKQAPTGPQQVTRILELYRSIFNAASAEAESLQQQLNTQLAKDKVSLHVQFVLSRDPLRPALPAPATSFLAITPDQVKELNQLGQFALNNQGTNPEQILTDILKAQMPPLQKGLSNITECANEVMNSATTFKNLLANNHTDIKETADNISKDGNQLKVLINQLSATQSAGVGQATAGTFLLGVQSQVSQITTWATSLATDLTKLRQQVIAATLVKTEQTAAMSFLATLEGCSNKILDSVTAAADQIPIISGILSSVGATNNVFVEVSREVKTVELTNLEPQDYDLSAHRVVAGDKVVITIEGVQQGNTKGQQLGTPFTVYVYNVAQYYVTTPILIFAQPSGEGSFHLGASYSGLVRRGSRRSLAINELANIGAGINLAALSFKQSNTLELGVGGVLSFANDLIQAGYGYNINASRGYWFFGLRLPIPGVR